MLHEAGIEYVFGISGGHTGRIITGLAKYQNSVRMVTLREESLAGARSAVVAKPFDADTLAERIRQVMRG